MSKLQEIYSVNKILEYFNISFPIEYKKYSTLLSKIVSNIIDGIRQDILNTTLKEVPSIDFVINKVRSELDSYTKNSIKKVINATGTILNTNFGRAVISKKIYTELEQTFVNYNNLEYDLENEIRGSRQKHISQILSYLTGSEDCLVLNNNASSVFLVCNTFAKNRDVIVSRGELIEIGDSFRLPEIIEHSGANLVEVGTTNRTYIHDFEKNITTNTSLLIKSHTSNYKIIGFTNNIKSKELSNLAKKHNLISFEDIGSGLLISPDKLGLQDEPYIIDKVKDGIDLICFSGDKLLGGAQAGIILGKKELIEKIKKNPLTRAFRIDKFSLSILEATLRLYLMNYESLINEIPTISMITESYDSLMDKSKNLLKKLEALSTANFEIIDYFSQIGGGSFPTNEIKTPVISILPSNISVMNLSKELKRAKIPIITRITNDRLIINLRTVFNDDLELLLDSIIKALK